MATGIGKYKPAVPRNVLIFMAGAVWVCVGTMLLVLAFTWLAQAPKVHRYAFLGAGFVLAMVAHHFAFLGTVDKNLARILATADKKCVFSFIPWRSYLLIMVMVTLGFILRHSAIPKPYLAVLYSGIGLALILSSVRYMRVLCSTLSKR